MSIEAAEKFKADLTDKFVVVQENVPELRRFAGLTGRVKTINMSCRALVEFDGPVDISWYDIDPAYLTVVDEPLKKRPQAKAAPPAAETKPAAKTAKKAVGKLSPLELARQQDADKQAAAASTQTEKPKKKLSPLELARQQDAGKSQDTSAETVTAKPAATPKPQPAGKKLSPLELARMQDAAGKKQSNTDGDTDGDTDDTSAPAAKPEKKTPAIESGGKKLSPLEMARMQDAKKE